MLIRHQYLDTGEPGRVRLWSRQWLGGSTVLAEAEHHAGSSWDYWYNLAFANSFPQVTHWWFGDAWTGMVRIWEPEAPGRDPESGAPMLSGWMRFGLGGTVNVDAANVDSAPPLPWSVVLTNPPRVSTPLPPMSARLVNLPLQFLLADRVMELLGMLVYRNKYQKDTPSGASLDVVVALTSLVRREDLHRAFPTEFGPWRLDRLPDLTPREALCRVHGLAPEPQLLQPGLGM